MKKFCLLLLTLSLSLSLLACAGESALGTTVPETTIPETSVPETTIPETSVPETTIPETSIPATTAPLHSALYMEGCSQEDVMTWFDEVVLHIEYTDGSGDPFRVQKWLQPIRCRIEGEPTDEDLRVLEDFFRQLNQVPGFPGISMAEEDEFENLTLSFLGPKAFRDSFSEVVNGEDAWGAAQFWYYNDNNEIHTARIGYRTDIDQEYRNSILLEEIVNCLGITDTELREDSIVYQYSNSNLCLSDVDWLILKLLYHPDMACGMDAEACQTVLYRLYH